jgi:hypothetical protein
MALVVIAWLDCGLLRLFVANGAGLLGLLWIGLCLSAALVVVVVGRGPWRRFACGFLVAGATIATAFYGVLLSVRGPAINFLLGYLRLALQSMPRWLTDGRVGITEVTAYVNGSTRVISRTYPSLSSQLLVECLVGIPWLILALAGGRLLEWVSRRSVPKVSNDPPVT